MNRTLRDIAFESYTTAWMVVIGLFLAEYEQFIRKYFGKG